MEKIIQQVNEWTYLQTLPAQIGGFSLVPERLECGTQYRIFTYLNSANRKSFSVLYDDATKDYMVRLVIGLTEMCDISFFTSDLAALEALLHARMEKTITNLDVFNPDILCTSFCGKKINEWAACAKLPQEYAGFLLYVQPSEPVKGLNGSYIIIDYSDFEAESNLMVFYNIYRDEFFAEVRIRRIPQMINYFDAKTLPDFEDKLENHLREALDNLRSAIGGDNLCCTQP